MQPGTLHFVLTTENTLVSGQHFFTPATLARSVCSYVVTLFAEHFVTNAKHECFLSAMQAFATWWARAIDNPGAFPTGQCILLSEPQRR
jgi:hypothetical protein